MGAKRTRKEIMNEYDRDVDLLREQLEKDLILHAKDKQMSALVRSSWQSDMIGLSDKLEHDLMYGTCEECGIYTSTRCGAILSRNYIDDDRDFMLVLVCPKCQKKPEYTEVEPDGTEVV